MKPFAIILSSAVFGLGAGCYAGAEVAEVALPVEVSAAGMGPAESDLGYTVSVDRLRAAISDIAFTVPGDGLVSAPAVRGLAGGGAGVPDYGHPGHVSGGEVTGELPGALLVEATAGGAALGTATLLAGDYTGVDFFFDRAHAGHGLDPSDPLLGHTFHIEGMAARNGATITFEAILDIDEGAQLIGAPFAHSVVAGDQARLRFAIHTTEPYAGTTIFDGIDFAVLDEDGDGHVSIEPGTEAHNRMRRALQVHDYYSVITQQGELP